MASLASLHAVLEQRKGSKMHVETSIQQTKESVRTKKRDLKRHEMALDIVRAAALNTQQQLQFHISDTVSSALDTVFDDPYEMIVEFAQRRNKTECDLFFGKDDARMSPLDASGCGVVDIASFALRIASWSMQRPRSRNLIILDEPFKHLSSNLLPRAGELLKKVSEEMNLQIIMVTHSDELIDAADKVFKVGVQKRISQVREA